MKTRKDAQLDALMELHRQTLAVLQETLSLLKSMQPVKRWFTLETQPSVPQPSVPYTRYIGPYFPPINPWGLNTTPNPWGPIITCGDELRTAPFGGLPGFGGMTCEGKIGLAQMNSSRTMDVGGVGV